MLVSSHDIEEVGVRTPDNVPVAALGPGEVGYLIAGIKDVAEARSGETVTTARIRGVGSTANRHDSLARVPALAARLPEAPLLYWT